MDVLHVVYGDDPVAIAMVIALACGWLVVNLVRGLWPRG